MDAIFAARDRERMQPTIDEHLDSPEIARYEAAIRGNAEHIPSLGDG